MLEWTGERFLPWLHEATMAYEHLHRYAYASTFVKDKRVLDLASGEGYGSKILAATASSVVGVDIDENAVRHASDKYGGTSLQFLTGSVTSVPIRADHSFDVIVCFEAIEHVDDHAALLSEVKRLLKPDGIFIVSTPNKAIYHHETEPGNPFHVKELEFQEFQDVIAKYFRNAQFLGQRIHPSSSIWPIGGLSTKSFHEFVVERGTEAFDFIPSDKRIALYFIAIASDAPTMSTPSPSMLIDQSNTLLAEKDDQLQATREEMRWREQQVADRDQTIKSRDETIKSLEGAVNWFERQVEDLTKGLVWTNDRVAELEKTIASHEDALAWRAGQVKELETAKEYWERQSEALTAQLRNTQRQLNEATDTLAAIHSSRGWKMLMKLRRIRDSFKALTGNKR